MREQRVQEPLSNTMDKIESMLPWQLAQEYPTTAEEAFVKSGNPVFDLDILEQIETDINVLPVLVLDFIEFGFFCDGNLMQIPSKS